MRRNLRAGVRQAGSGNRDDLRNPAADRGRGGAEQSLDLSHDTFSFCAGSVRARRENGHIWLSRRYLWENNDKAVAEGRFGSGFVARIEVTAKEIFSSVLAMRRAPPLPLAGEVYALEERGGWGLSPHRESQCRSTPTPTLPRKRERERTFFV